MNTVVSAHLTQYEQAIAQGRLSTACGHLQAALALTGDTPDLLAPLGSLHLALGRTAEAENAAWRAITLNPRHNDTLKLLGQIQVASTRNRQQRPQELPGTPHTRYLMPLDYLPSRKPTHRWGYDKPPHAGLSALFARNHDAYLQQIGELRSLVPNFRAIQPVFGQNDAEAGWTGAAANALDLAFVYYFVWKHRPKTYLEIGSGATTCFARRAVRDHQLGTRIISIDPEPRAAIDRICDEVVRDGLETLPDLGIFSRLEPGDILFLDGSHRCFMNSDVTVFFLDVLPLLKPGVIVHIHDIALPLDYPEWARPWYWNEQYMLAAYLMGKGDQVDVLMPVQYLCSTAGLKEKLDPPILTGVGDPGAWKDGGSFWFTHR